jgi:hypothetical protein
MFFDSKTVYFHSLVLVRHAHHEQLNLMAIYAILFALPYLPDKCKTNLRVLFTNPALSTSYLSFLT